MIKIELKHQVFLLVRESAQDILQMRFTIYSEFRGLSLRFTIQKTLKILRRNNMKQSLFSWHGYELAMLFAD